MLILTILTFSCLVAYGILKSKQPVEPSIETIFDCPECIEEQTRYLELIEDSMIIDLLIDSIETTHQPDGVLVE